MVKIFKIVKKDMQEFYRESNTFKIVTLSPIAIIIIFGFIFARGVPSSINLPMRIGLCALDESVPADFIESLTEESWVQIEEVESENEQENCENAVKTEISRGYYKGGIVIPSNFMSDIRNGNQTNVRVYIDNSLVRVEWILRGYFWRAIQQYSEGLMEDPAELMDTQLSGISSEIGNMKDSISYSESIGGLKQKIDDLNADVQAIDTESYTESTSNMITELDDVDAEMDSTNTEITNIRGDISGYITDLEDTKTSLEYYDTRVLDAKEMLEEVHNSTCDFGGFPPPPDTIQMCSDLETTIDDLETTHQDIQDNIGLIDSMITDLEETDASLQTKQQTISEIKTDISSSKDELVTMNTEMVYLDNMKTNTQSFAEDFVAYSDDVTEEEAELKTKLGVFESNVNDVLLAASLATQNPINIDTMDMFEGRSFLDFMMPTLIGFLAMFISIFLSSTTIISEKKSGTLRRNLLTPLSLSSFITGKVLSIILIGLIEISVLVLVGALLYGIVFPTLLWQFVASVVLSLMSFIAIGLIIGIWSDSGSTAVLFSVTLMIVLIFVSGVVIPSELLPKIVSDINSVLPLSNIISLFKGLFVYNVIDMKAIVYLSVISAGGIILSVISIKRQV